MLKYIFGIPIFQIMKVYTLLKRGTNHKDFCEDYLISVPLNEQIQLFGVLDGCSSGIDSYFASALTGKIIKNAAKEITNFKTKVLSEILKELFFNSFMKIIKIKKKIGLTTNELLSTCILFLYDKINNYGEIIVSGDGFISINYEKILIDKNNIPNYFIYNEKRIKHDFEKLYNKEIEQYHVQNAIDITISTDGILSFTKQNNSDKSINHIEYLTSDTKMIKNTSMLYKKYNILKNKYGLLNYDDVGMVRILF